MKLQFPYIVYIMTILFVILGVLIKYRKAYWLISGYNTLDENMKKSVDIVKLSVFVGNCSFAIAVITLAMAIFLTFNMTILAWVSSLFILPIAIYLIIYAKKINGGNTKNIIFISIISCLFVIVQIGVGILLFHGNRSSEFIITSNSIEIKGLYGEVISTQLIERAYLKESLPDIVEKVNGASFGNMKKGYFLLEDIGRAKLFLNVSNSPYLFIQKKDGLVILNCDNMNDTKELFTKIDNIVKQRDGE